MTTISMIAGAVAVLGWVLCHKVICGRPMTAVPVCRLSIVSHSIGVELFVAAYQCRFSPS